MTPSSKIVYRSGNVSIKFAYGLKPLTFARERTVSSYADTLPPAQKSTWQGGRRDGGCGPTLVSFRFLSPLPWLGNPIIRFKCEIARAVT